MSNYQLNRLKWGGKYGTEVVLNFPSNVICDSNGKNNFLHKLLLTDIQLARLRQAFANNVSASIKLLNTELCKMTQLGVFLGILLGYHFC